MIIQEIRVSRKEDVDSRIQGLNQHLSDMGIGCEAVACADVYRFQEIDESDAQKLADQVLTDPITQISTVNKPLFDEGYHILEIGYKPGVMNPVSASLEHAANTLHIYPTAASSSTEYHIQGDITEEQLQVIGKRLTSQVETIIDKKPEALIIHENPGLVDSIPIRVLDDGQLVLLSEERRMFLTLEEMRVIQEYYKKSGKDPTDIEIEMIAQTWSEHCGHKTFKGKLITEEANEKPPLIKRIKDTSQKYFDRVGVVTAFQDNAGGIRFYDGQVIIAKGETHNSPVAVEPYGGSMTKNGGVYRDIAGCGEGGENKVAFMVNCFGLPDTKDTDILPGSLHPKYLLLENFRGERDYGNRMGIPTHATTLRFHPDFGPKPTSMGIVIGMISEAKSRKSSPQSGDILLTVGGKTGRDGIHGATFSSGAMSAETSTVDATAVQIGNAIEEKRMFDALRECEKANVVSAITDVGGGGYSSAIGELGADTGVIVHLDHVPLKYQGLAPWEIWLSESQERMVVAVHPENLEKFKHICSLFETPVDVIGKFTNDNMLILQYKDEVVGQLSMDFLHHGLPQRELLMKYVPIHENNDIPDIPTDWTDVYKKVLGHLNVASTEEMLRRFDTTVQGTTVLHPFSGVYQDAPNDASIIAPIYEKPYGVVTSHAVNPILNRYDPYQGAIWTVAMAASKFTSTGGNINEAAMIDNFVWPKPTPKFLGDLDRSVDGLCKMMDVLKIPCVSGKDSLSSTYKNNETEINIPPVLTMTIFGRIPDVEKTVSSDIKEIGSTLVLVGTPDIEHLGGSIYFQTQGIENTHIPEVDIDRLPTVLANIYDAIHTGTVKSCKAIGEGGFATALAHMCFGGDCGASVDMQPLHANRIDTAFFNETPGTFIVEVANEDTAHELFSDIPHVVIGKTIEEKIIQVREGEKDICTANIYDLKHAWQIPMKEVLS